MPVVVRDAASAAATYLVDAAVARRLLPGSGWTSSSCSRVAPVLDRVHPIPRQRPRRLQRGVARVLRPAARRAARRTSWLGAGVDLMRSRLATWIWKLPVNQHFTCAAGSGIWGLPRRSRRSGSRSRGRSSCRLVMGGRHVADDGDGARWGAHDPRRHDDDVHVPRPAAPPDRVHLGRERGRDPPRRHRAVSSGITRSRTTCARSGCRGAHYSACAREDARTLRGAHRVLVARRLCLRSPCARTPFPLGTSSPVVLGARRAPWPLGFEATTCLMEVLDRRACWTISGTHIPGERRGHACCRTAGTCVGRSLRRRGLDAERPPAQQRLHGPYWILVNRHSNVLLRLSGRGPVRACGTLLWSPARSTTLRSWSCATRWRGSGDRSRATRRRAAEGRPESPSAKAVTRTIVAACPPGA